MIAQISGGEFVYNSEDTAKRIKAMAKQQKISLKVMLPELGLGINLISQSVKGQSISGVNLARIADYLDCSVDYLLGRTENPEVNR